MIVTLDSAGTDGLGRAGFDGDIDTQFWTRFGGTMLLSVIDDALAALVVSSSNADTIENTTNGASNLAQTELQSTINVPIVLRKNQGEEVAVIAMIDTPLPVRPELSRQDRAWIKLHEFREKGPRYVSEWIRTRFAWEVSRRKAPVQDLGGGAFNNAKIEAAFLESVAHYELKPWDGLLALFRPPLDRKWKVSGGNWVSDERQYVYDDNEWGNWASNMRIIEVPGDHDSMVLVPNVSVLCEHLREILDSADSPHPVKQAAE